MKKATILLFLVLAAACSLQGAGESQDNRGSAGTQVPRSVSTLPPSQNENGEAAVSGALLLAQDGDGVPVQGVLLYLAKVLQDQSGQDSLASLDRANDPRVVTKEDGGFEFRSVAPGKYALVLDMVNQTYILMNPLDGEPMIISIEDQRSIDLGELAYASLPVRVGTPEN